MKYHYEYAAYTDNLCYGRMLLGKGRTRSETLAIGQWANKGVFTIEKYRVYESNGKVQGDDKKLP